MNIAVIGTVYVDIKGYPLGNFVPKGRNVGDVQQFHGGVGRNIAEDVVSFGENVSLVSLVDKTGIVIDVKGRLERRGIHTGYMRSTDDGMGTWMAIFDRTGELCANISKRPNLLPIRDILVEHGDEIFTWADSVLLELDMEEEIAEETFRLAEKHGVPVYIVISNIELAMERMKYVRKAECFICNRLEAQTLLGEQVDNPEAMLILMQKKKDSLGIKNLVVTMDVDGAAYLDEKGNAGICPAKKVKVVDTTGAGDAFFSGTAVGLTRGESLEDACCLGTEAASQVIGKPENVYIA
jgi:pseudouridine kinase